MTYRDPYRRSYRHYRRRMRRFGRRYGEYPMLLIGPGEPLSLIAAAAIGRWLYRHRSAFWPFGITAAAFIAANAIHHHHARYWILAAVLTFQVTVTLAIPHRLVWTKPAGKISTGLVSRLWNACGIDRPAERAYATTIVAVTGGWLSAAIAAGPTAKPLPDIALAATVILGIPWWSHRRRRARVRAERTIQNWPTVAENMGLPGSRIASIVVDAWGWTARVILRKGTSTQQAVNQIPAIESGLGLRPGSVRVFPDHARADRFILRVIEHDPHAAPIPWPGPATNTITRPAGIGLSEDGRAVSVLLLRRNALIGGTTGAGKSGVVNDIIAVLAACADVELWGIDLKGGMELQPWAECFHKLATTPREADELFREAVGRLDERAAQMAVEGKRIWEPTPDDPALVIIIDEYAELPDQSHECADSIARRGRAVAVNLIAATQRPTQAAMGANTAVRSQMDVRICLRVRERRDVDLILGQGAFNAGWRAHQLTKPGEFLISDPEHTTPERHRAYLITDEQITRHAATCAATHSAGGPEIGPQAPQSPQTSEQGHTHGTGHAGPETALWAALTGAGPGGVPVAELVTACGMGRSWVYYRLSEHAAAGRAVQVKRGYWRAAPPPDTATGDGRPPPRPTPGRPPGRPRRTRRRRPPAGDGE